MAPAKPVRGLLGVQVVATVDSDGPGQVGGPGGGASGGSGCRVTITHSAFMFMMPRSTTTEYVDKQGW